MLRLNTMLTNRGFKPATFVDGRRMWVRGTEAVVRHERNSTLYRRSGKQHIELIDKNNKRTIYSYDNPNMRQALDEFIQVK